MRRITIYILFILCCSILSCNNPKNTPILEPSDFTLVQQERLWYKEGNNKPFTGIYIQRRVINSEFARETEYKDGELVQEKRYDFSEKGLKVLVHSQWTKSKDGNPYEKELIEYDKNGRKKREISYQDISGIEKWYYANGNLLSEQELYEGKRHGKNTEYHRDEKRKKESNWENGKQQGYTTEWEYYNDGSLMRETHSSGTYSAGTSEGNYRKYFPDGKLEEEGEWNPTNGWHKVYSVNGKLIEDMVSLGNANVDSDYKYYFEDTGKLREEYSRKSGAEVLRKTYYKNGKVKTLNEHGIEKSYYKNGKLMSESRYNDEYALVSAKAYYENGQILSDLHFKDHLLDGMQTRYSPTGKIEAKINFKDGNIIDRSSQTFYPDGKPQSRIEYDSNGKVLEGEVFYTDGKIFVERRKEASDTIVNINIFPENKIFSDSHDHVDNTLYLSYFISGNQDNRLGQEYFESGKAYPENEEGEQFADCGCGPDEGDYEYYEYIYTENNYSGTIKIQSDPVIEIVYIKGNRKDLAEE